jgi:hypothetical protein
MNALIYVKGRGRHKRKPLGKLESGKIAPGGDDSRIANVKPEI